jgi:hypothetical protein
VAGWLPPEREGERKGEEHGKKSQDQAWWRNSKVGRGQIGRAALGRGKPWRPISRDKRPRASWGRPCPEYAGTTSKAYLGYMPYRPCFQDVINIPTATET